jgi:hypothetical protein
VGIGLMFATAVKLILVPAQIARKNVSWRTLGLMLLGGVPGVLLGSFFLQHLANAHSTNTLNALLGAILVTTASWQIIYSFRPMRQHAPPDRGRLLPWLMFPVGAEVGFSSAGAGALGSAALLSLTTLLPAQVVGTDITFGFVISGGVAGAVVGTVLTTHIPRRPLRLVLWVWLLILGGQFLFNSYQVWASPSTRKNAAPVVHNQSAPNNVPRG